MVGGGNWHGTEMKRRYNGLLAGAAARIFEKERKRGGMARKGKHRLPRSLVTREVLQCRRRARGDGDDGRVIAAACDVATHVRISMDVLAMAVAVVVIGA